MKTVTFSPTMLETLSFLSNNLDKEGLKRDVPSINSLGEPITDVKSLAAVMGVSEKIAAAYALESEDEDLKSDAIDNFTLGIYSPADEAYTVVQYAASVAHRNPEYKRIRMVRTSGGVRRFGQKLGTIIVTDGEQPLDAIRAVTNDVEGYDKVKDKEGNAYYVGFEGGKWVVRSGQTKAILYETDNRTNGQEEALYWLNEQLGGRKAPATKRLEADMEDKDARSLDRHPESTNWVENTGELPRYIREIANALIRERGFSISRAIATAVNRVKDWATDPDVSAATRAKALKALAEWNALKAKNKARRKKD